MTVYFKLIMFWNWNVCFLYKGILHLGIIWMFYKSQLYYFYTYCIWSYLHSTYTSYAYVKYIGGLDLLLYIKSCNFKLTILLCPKTIICTKCINNWSVQRNKCGYCGWILTNNMELLQHSCFSQYDEAINTIVIDENNIVSIGKFIVISYPQFLSIITTIVIMKQIW